MLFGYYATVLEINFLAGGKYLLPGIKCSSKANILVANIVCYIITQLAPIVRFMTKHKIPYGQKHL